MTGLGRAAASGFGRAAASGFGRAAAAGRGVARIATDLRVTVRARGAADPAAVWERYARPELWASWSPPIQAVRYGHPRLVAGTSGEVIGPLGLTIQFTIEAVDEAARTWSWRAAIGPVGVRLVHAVAAHGSGTSTSLVLFGPAPIVMGYAPLARVSLGRLVRP